MGSANLNDRSQKVRLIQWCCSAFIHCMIQGDGDSEIALVVEDDDLIESKMNGERYMASRFAATLRRKLYRGTYPSIYHL